GGLEIDRGFRASQERHARLVIACVVDPGRNPRRLRVESGGGPLAPGAQLSHGSEVRVRLQPAVPGQRTQWLSPASGFESTGKSRAPRPNRKIVAAIKPTEMPHSKIEGQYEWGATQGMRPRNVMAKRTT